MKKILLAAALVFAAILLVSCGGDPDAELVLDIDALAAKLAAEVPFEDQLALAEERIISTAYSFKNASDIAVYTGSGAFAEEIIIAEASDTEKAKALEKELSDHLAAKTERFTSYKPSELSKLDSALLIRRGKYVIYCVSTKDLSGVINSHFE